MPYTVKELQSVPSCHPNYGAALRILARIGALEVPQSPERKEVLEAELTSLVEKTYFPKIGDDMVFEDYKSGVRYKGTVTEVMDDGWVRATPCSYHPKHWLLIDVKRNKKQIYSW